MIDEKEIDGFRHTEYNSDPVVMEMLCALEALWKVARAADKAVGWMEPVMGGLSIPKDAKSRTDVLYPLKKALAALHADGKK